MNKEKMVSVILFVENSEDKEILEAVNHIKKQTYKNIELIISSFSDENSEDIKKECSNKFLNIRWINHKPSEMFINETLQLVNGDVVFYKTINGCEWYPRHIQSHMEIYSQDKISKWSLSHIENKDIEKSNIIFNTLGYRISNPPKIESIIIDEIAHISKIETDWSHSVRGEGKSRTFVAGVVIKQWMEKGLKGFMPPEITVIQWGYAGNGSENNDKEYDDIARSFGVPILTEVKEEINETENGIEIKRKIPTIVGNIYHNEHNERFESIIEQTENVSSIGIKRTVGMGDVIVTEPIIRKLKQKYPNAKITYYTLKDNITKFFQTKPDEVVVIEEKDLFEDYLSKTDNDICYDLDLSYESRKDISFIDAYAEVCSIDFENSNDKKPVLLYEDERLIEDDYVVLCADGSGWPGKQWPLSNYEEVIEHLQNKGIKVIETGTVHTSLTPTEYHECDFDTMLNLIRYCSFYIGGDNGPMHIARGFDIPSIIVAGAALPYYTSPNRDNIVYIENNKSKSLGIKHKQFFNKVNTKIGYTFVPISKEDPSCGLRDITPELFNRFIDRFLDKPLSPDGNEMDYAFNIYGTLSDNDLVNGYFYYKDNKTDIYWRENPTEHPEQSLNISLLYEYEADKIWENNLNNICSYIEYKMPNSKRILDVGCNMGIFVNGCLNKDMDVYGIDINEKSIETGINRYGDKLRERITHGDYLTYEYDQKFDTIVCNEIINNVDNPRVFINKLNNDLNEDGCVFINYFDIECKNWDIMNRKWGDLGVGEKTNFFTNDAFIKLIQSNGFEIIDEYYKNEQLDMKFFVIKKVYDVKFNKYEKIDNNEKNKDDIIIYKDKGLTYKRNDDGIIERDRPHYHLEHKQRSPIQPYFQDMNYIKNSYEEVLEEIKNNIDKNFSILDIGCGSGYLINELIKEGFSNVRGYDITKLSIQAAKEYFKIDDKIFLKDITGNIESEQNDCLVLNNVISYVGNYKLLFENIGKLLRENGIVYLKSIINNNNNYDCLKYLDIITLFNNKDIEKIIKSSGFTIEKTTINEQNIFIKAIKNG